MPVAIEEPPRATSPEDYRNVNTAEGRILLVGGGHRLLSAFPRDLSQSARNQLENLGVTPLTGALVIEIDEDGVTLQHPDGTTERVGARTVVWAAGVAAASLAGRLAEAVGEETDRAGRLTVAPDLTLPG